MLCAVSTHYLSSAGTLKLFSFNETRLEFFFENLEPRVEQVKRRSSHFQHPLEDTNDTAKKLHSKKTLFINYNISLYIVVKTTKFFFFDSALTKDPTLNAALLKWETVLH